MGSELPGSSAAHLAFKKPLSSCRSLRSNSGPWLGTHQGLGYEPEQLHPMPLFFQKRINNNSCSAIISDPTTINQPSVPFSTPLQCEKARALKSHSTLWVSPTPFQRSGMPNTEARLENYFTCFVLRHNYKKPRKTTWRKKSSCIMLVLSDISHCMATLHVEKNRLIMRLTVLFQHSALIKKS